MNELIINHNPLTPLDNLSINEFCVKLSRNRDELIGRVYTHTKGVILSTNQSINDLYLNNCESMGYEIVRRPSGGSAIIVNPELTLCYSFFFPTKLFGGVFDFDKIYKTITEPLVKELGEDFSVEGNYYIRYKGVPFAGHAIKSHNGVTQFDGVMQLKSFDMDELNNLIKLRELHEYNSVNCIKVNDKYYDFKGNNLKVDGLTALIRDEYEELNSISGAQELGLNNDYLIKTITNIVNKVFGECSVSNSLRTPDLSIYKELISKRLNKGRKNNLGHCFIDLLEPEQKL